MKSMLEWCRKQSNVARVGHTMSCELISKALVQSGRAKQKPRNSMQKQLSRHISDSHEKHTRMVSKTIECGTSRPHNVMRTHFESAGTIWKSKQKPRNSMQKQLSRHISDSHEKHARMVSKTIECGTSRPHNVMRTHFESAGTIWKSKQKLSNLMQKQLHRPKGIHMQGTFDCRKKAFRQGRHDHRRCSHSSNCKV
jgi:DNA-binding FadR family transcriptional regulator